MLCILSDIDWCYSWRLICDWFLFILSYGSFSWLRDLSHFLTFSPIFVSIYVHSSSSNLFPPIHSTLLYSDLLISSLLSSSLIKSHLLPSAFLSYLLLSPFSSPHIFSLTSPLLPSHLLSPLLPSPHFSSPLFQTTHLTRTSVQYEEKHPLLTWQT